MIEQTNILGKDTLIFLAVTIGLFCWQLRHILKMRNLKGETNKFKNFTERLKKSMYSEKELNLDKDYKSRKEIEGKIKNKIYLEYEEGIESSYKWNFLNENIDDYTMSLKNRGLESVEPSQYFNEENILDRNFNIQGLNQVGPTLIGLGIIGTFFGLITGLYKIGMVNKLMEDTSKTNDMIDVAANTAATGDMLSAISEVIPSMSLAFVTSLAGMGLSLIYTFLYKREMGYIQKNIHQIGHNLSIIFPINSDIHTLLIDIKENLNNFGDNLEIITGGKGFREIQKQETEIWQGIGSGIQKSIGGLGDTITTQLRSVFNEGFIKNFEQLDNSLKTTIAQMQIANETFTKVIKDIPKVAKSFETVNSTSTAILKNSQESMGTYDKFLKETSSFINAANIISEVQKGVNSSTEKMGEMNVSTVNKYEEIQNNMRLMFDNFQNAIKNSGEITVETHKNISKEINEALNKENEKTEKSLEKFGEAIERYIEKTLSAEHQLKEMVEEFKVAYSSKESYYDGQYGKITDAQRELVQVIEKNLNSYGDVVSKINREMVDVIKNMRNME